MTLEDAVELVLFSFEHAQPGDIFVQKAPACTIGDLAQALKELLNADNPVQVIGTRHGEKLYETLLTREEMAHAEDMGRFYRIPADNRDLNYDKYFVQGQEELSLGWEYNSHNTERLDVEATKRLLLKLEVVRSELLMRQESKRMAEVAAAMWGENKHD